MKNEGESGRKSKGDRTRRSSDDDGTEKKKRSSKNLLPTPKRSTDSTSRLRLGALRGGVSDFFRRIHWQPNNQKQDENSNTSLDANRLPRASRRVRKLDARSKVGMAAAMTGSKTKENYHLDVAVDKEKEEAKRMKRRRRSSRTKKRHNYEEKGDERVVEYFPGRHLEERQVRRERQDLKDRSSEDAFQNYFPYGDIGSSGICDKKQADATKLHQRSSEEFWASTDREKISEGEIPYVLPQKPSEGEVTQIKRIRKSHQDQESLKSPQQISKRRKRRKLEEAKLILETKKMSEKESGEVSVGTQRVEAGSREEKVITTSKKKQGHKRNSTRNADVETSDRKIERQAGERGRVRRTGKLKLNSETPLDSRVALESQSKQEQEQEPPLTIPSSEEQPSLSVGGYFDNFMKENLLDYYLRSPAQILAENQTSASGRTQRSRSISRPPPTTRVTLIPAPPPQIGPEPRIRTPAAPSLPIPAAPPSPPPPPPQLSFQDAELLRQRIESYTRLGRELLPQTKTRSETVMEMFRNYFLPFSSSSSKELKKLDTLAYARLKEARKAKGPLWQIDLFERNREKNKLANKTYAVTFGWGYKRTQLRSRQVSLMDNFLDFAKKKHLKYFKKNPKDGVYGVGVEDYEYDPNRANANTGGYYDEYNGDSGDAPTDPKMDYIHHVLTKPIDTSKYDTDPWNIEPPKVLDFSHLINPDLNTNQAQDPVPATDEDDRPSSYLEHFSSTNSNSNAIDISSILSSTYPRKTRGNFLRNHAITSLTPLLQDSSKVSEKTHVLLQAARVTSASQLKYPLTGSSKPPVTNKDGLFDADTLAKIYTPKTDFTRQFASLLPSFNKDTNLSHYDQYL